MINNSASIPVKKSVLGSQNLEKFIIPKIRVTKTCLKTILYSRKINKSNQIFSLLVPAAFTKESATY